METFRLSALPTGHDLSSRLQRSWREGLTFTTHDYVFVDGHPWVCLRQHIAINDNRPGGPLSGSEWDRALQPDSLYIIGGTLYSTDDAVTPAATSIGGGGGDGGLVAVGSPLTVDSPLSYIDVLLPSGYVAFKLTAIDFQMDAGDILAMAFSDDGGATFHFDTDTYAAYEVQVARISTAETTDTALSGYKGGDSLASLTRSSDDGANELGTNDATQYGRTVEMTIFPGAVGRRASVLSTVGGTTGPNSNGIFVDFSRIYMPTPGVQNMMRLLPYGNGDIPPTAVFKLTGGTIFLLGLS